MNILFSPKLRGARSGLYRRRFLQVNTRWKALAENYTMHSFALFSNLNFFVKNRQNFFANFWPIYRSCIEANFASRYTFESSRRDLHNALLCTAPESHLKNAGILQTKGAKFFRNVATK